VSDLLEHLLPGAAHLQNVHPLLVHFPLALMPSALLLYVLAWATHKESWAWTGLWLLGLGALGAAVSVASGLYGAEGVMIDPSVKEHLLFYHKRLMLGALGLAAVLSAWALFARPMPIKGRGFFLALLLILVAVLAIGADFGGRMVYDYNAGGNACPQPIPYQD
jgi:uncharacterized membrane protein